MEKNKIYRESRWFDFRKNLRSHCPPRSSPRENPFWISKKKTATNRFFYYTKLTLNTKKLNKKGYFGEIFNFHRGVQIGGLGLKRRVIFACDRTSVARRINEWAFFYVIRFGSDVDVYSVVELFRWNGLKPVGALSRIISELIFCLNVRQKRQGKVFFYQKIKFKTNLIYLIRHFFY